MGMIVKQPIPNTIYWVMSDPFTHIPFMSPKKVMFLKNEFLQEDNREYENYGGYLSSYIFDEGIRIPIHSSELKTGHKITMGYYVSETSAHLIQVMKRIAYPERFDIKPKDDFDYKWFRKILSILEKEHPELLI